MPTPKPKFSVRPENFATLRMKLSPGSSQTQTTDLSTSHMYVKIISTCLGTNKKRRRSMLCKYRVLCWTLKNADWNCSKDGIVGNHLEVTLKTSVGLANLGTRANYLRARIKKRHEVLSHNKSWRFSKSPETTKQHDRTTEGVAYGTWCCNPCMRIHLPRELVIRRNVIGKCSALFSNTKLIVIVRRHNTQQKTHKHTTTRTQTSTRHTRAYREKSSSNAVQVLLVLRRRPWSSTL